MTLQAKPPSALLKSAQKVGMERTVTVKYVNDKNTAFNNRAASEFLSLDFV